MSVTFRQSCLVSSDIYRQKDVPQFVSTDKRF